MRKSPKNIAHNPLIAAQYRIASAFLQAASGAVIRVLGQDIPVGELVFVRATMGVAILLAFYGIRRELAEALGTAHPLRHAGRTLSSVTSSVAYFAAVVYLPLVDVTVLAYCSPFIAVGLAAVVLRERVRAYRWSAVCLGFVGVVIMIWPYLASTRLLATAGGMGAALALGSALGSAISAVQIHRLVQTERTSAIIFYFYAASMLASAISLPFWFVIPSNGQWLALLAMGIGNILSQTFVTQSYRYAPASSVVIFDYTTIVFAFLIGYFFLGELPGYLVYFGGAIVTAASIFVVLRERKLNKIIATAAVVNTDRVR